MASRRGLQKPRKLEKLTPRFVRLFQILNKVGDVAYKLALPPQFAGLHDVFHVSMLRKYKPDPTHILNFQDLEIQNNISLEDKLIQIMDRRDQLLRRKVIPLVKVLWTRHGEEEAT